MRISAVAALLLAVPLLAGTGNEALAGGWCDRPAYYAVPVRAYRYAYAPAPAYYYRYTERVYGYGPRLVGYGPAPFYRYRRPFGFYSGWGYGGWGGPGVAIGFGY